METLCKEYDLAKDLIDWQSRDFTGETKYQWTYLNEGSFRIVYLGPDQMVYKLPIYLDEDSIRQNEGEFNNWERLQSFKPFVYGKNKFIIPAKVQMFTFPHIGYFDGWHANVIRMPFYQGRKLTRCEDNCGYDLENCIEFEHANIYYQMWDITSDNVIVLADETRVIVDLQC